MEMAIPKEKELSMIRKYPIEVLVVILIAVIGFLGGWLWSLNGKVNQLQETRITYFSGNTEVLIKALDNSTRAIERNNQTNERVYEALLNYKAGKNNQSVSPSN